MFSSVGIDKITVWKPFEDVPFERLIEGQRMEEGYWRISNALHVARFGSRVKVALCPAKQVNGHNLVLATPEVIARAAEQVADHYGVFLDTDLVCEVHITATVEREEPFDQLRGFFRAPKGYKAADPLATSDYYNGATRSMLIYDKRKQSGLPMGIEFELTNPNLLRVELKVTDKVSKQFRERKLIKYQLTYADLASASGFWAALRYFQIALPKFYNIPPSPSKPTKQNERSILRELFCTPEGFNLLQARHKSGKIEEEPFRALLEYREEILRYDLGVSLRTQIDSSISLLMSRYARL